ncbi:type II toxin-antitoxin system RelE/ParE family toxin [Taklimakanibacter deserti]|uniref:type II toxin-antitoxin system RelE/ParE family toxin n=1 Tax=Taklimakanibacter deserti TaxID=2267839 RepID=UPI000E656AC8
MIEIVVTKAFDEWINDLRDREGQRRILARIRHYAETGDAGDACSIGDGIREMRFHFGPGYRVYYLILRKTIILLGGDKSTQVADIRKAKQYADYWKGQKL